MTKEQIEYLQETLADPADYDPRFYNTCQQLLDDYDKLLSASRHVWDKAMLTIHDDTDDEAAGMLAAAIGYKYERKFK